MAKRGIHPSPKLGDDLSVRCNKRRTTTTTSTTSWRLYRASVVVVVVVQKAKILDGARHLLRFGGQKQHSPACAPKGLRMDMDVCECLSARFLRPIVQTTRMPSVRQKGFVSILSLISQQFKSYGQSDSISKIRFPILVTLVISLSISCLSHTYEYTFFLYLPTTFAITLLLFAL